MNETMRHTLAEFIGTFTLVFIGAATGALLGGPDSGPLASGMLAVALAHGFALLVIVYAWGSISGAHVNPAVTLGIALTGRMPWAKAGMYWAAQFLGGIFAALLLKFLIGETGGLGQTIGSLTNSEDGMDIVRVILIEAILTFFLLIAVFASGVAGRSGNAAGMAIGMVLTMDILAGGALTGASMNPARTLGPALAMGNMDYVWMYLVGPFLGGAAGALLYDRIFLPEEEKPPVEAAKEPRRRRR